MTLPPPKVSPPTTPKRRLWPWIAGGAVVLALIVGVGVWLALPSTEDKAVTYCQEDVITPTLKAPTTAEFSKVSVEHEDGTELYRVRGAVDSQNGFGAMVRADFDCNMRYEGGRWGVITQDVTQR